MGFTQEHPSKDDSNESKEFMEWFTNHPVSKKISKPVNFISHGNYKYLISIDGFGAAWTRVPYILCTGSVLLLRADCHEFFYKLMQPNETHIEINSGLTNLEERYKYLEENPEIAQRIGDQGRRFAIDYLNPDALDFYLKTVIYQLNEAYEPPESAWGKIKLTWAKMCLFLGV